MSSSRIPIIFTQFTMPSRKKSATKSARKKAAIAIKANIVKAKAKKIHVKARYAVTRGLNSSQLTPDISTEYGGRPDEEIVDHYASLRDATASARRHLDRCYGSPAPLYFNWHEFPIPDTGGLICIGAVDDNEGDHEVFVEELGGLID